MENVILVIHVLAAAAVIGLVLLQHGKGADMGAAFGSGASGSLFGVSGSSNLLSKLTAIFVTVFFVTSLTLAYLSSHKSGHGSVVKSALTKEVPASTDAAVTKSLENTTKDIPN
jgi:preprotein translocase subunit SecG